MITKFDEIQQIIEQSIQLNTLVTEILLMDQSVNYLHIFLEVLYPLNIYIIF